MNSNANVNKDVNKSSFNETRLEQPQNYFDDLSKIENLSKEIQGESALQILSTSSYIDEIDYFHVVGEVKNNGQSTLTFVQVVGTFYDTNGRVVGTTFTYTNPKDIMADETTPFELILLSASIPMSQITDYRVSANSQ